MLDCFEKHSGVCAKVWGEDESKQFKEIGRFSLNTRKVYKVFWEDGGRDKWKEKGLGDQYYWHTLRDGSLRIWFSKITIVFW